MRNTGETALSTGCTKAEGLKGGGGNKGPKISGFSL